MVAADPKDLLPNASLELDFGDKLPANWGLRTTN